MKYYKKNDNTVWAFETDGTQDYLITGEFSALSSAELVEHLKINTVTPEFKKFTSLDYLDLFTEAEQLAVVQATMQNAQVKLWYDKMLAAGYITLDDPRTELGLAALVQAGLLQESRKLIILAAMQ